MTVTVSKQAQAAYDSLQKQLKPGTSGVINDGEAKKQLKDYLSTHASDPNRNDFFEQLAQASQNDVNDPSYTREFVRATQENIDPVASGQLAAIADKGDNVTKAELTAALNNYGMTIGITNGAFATPFFSALETQLEIVNGYKPEDAAKTVAAYKAKVTGG